MLPFELTATQQAIAAAPLTAKTCLSGPAGTGKTTTGVARLAHWLESGVPAERIFILTPQRTLDEPYRALLTAPARTAGGEVNLATLGGLARRMVELFWPLVVEPAGFGDPYREPTFLTLETAQYFMARLVEPLLAEGYFDGVTIDRNRLYSQIIDNLNKAAVVGFPHTEIGERLAAASSGDSQQRKIYTWAQECASRFRTYCLEHNLLDFSLQVECFRRYLWPDSLCREMLQSEYTHLLFDNVEEDTPVAHDVVRDWLPTLTGALLISDTEAGYRRFLGADPEGVDDLSALCTTQVTFTESFVASPPLQLLGQTLSQALRQPVPPLTDPVEPAEMRKALHYTSHRFHPQMLDWAVETIAALVRDEGVPPGEIVVLAPFLTDALRFSLAHRLAERGLPVRSHRPSRALRDEPAARTLLTLAALGYPQWGFVPSQYDIAYALQQAIETLDLVRAQLLAQVLYRVAEGQPTLRPFDTLNAEMQQRVTYILGERYEMLRRWLAHFATLPPTELDHFLARLFGEVLSQPGFGFHAAYDAGEVAANLIESVRKFRWIGGCVDDDVLALGREYVQMVEAGVVAAQYVRSWLRQPEDAVLLTPAYTFLMMNRPVDYQFWLNVGGSGWWERLYQPLTHPYVLSRRWEVGAQWRDSDEYAARQRALHRLVLGLIRRCRQGIYLGLSDLSEQGYEQQGALLAALQYVLRGLR